MNRSRALAMPLPILGLLLATVALALAGSGKHQTLDEVALRYGRAVYANDAQAIWRLLSTDDRRVKDEATFRRQQRRLDGFTHQVVQQLAGFITATPVSATFTDERASVTLRFRLPDANAPAIRTLMHDWDEERLNRLDDGERRRVREQLDQLQREGRLPTIEGDETVELVREASGWKVFLNWAAVGVRVQFGRAVDRGRPLEVTVTPAAAVLAPGERIRVTVRARNNDRREVTTRVGHRIEPEAHADSLALLLCPLFLPVTLAPGEAREFVSEYLLLADVPAAARTFTVTYQFR